jgi:glucokinase
MNCSIAQRSGGRFKTTHELVAAHLAGDADASKVWLKSLRALACAIASFINILDPAAVIIGGGIARCGSALFGPLQKLLDEVEWRPAGQRVFVIPAALGEYAGAYGAAWKGLQSD